MTHWGQTLWLKQLVGVLLGVCLLFGTAVVVQAQTKHTTAGITLQADPNDSNRTLALKSLPNIDFGTQHISVSASQFQAQSVDAPVAVVNPGLSTGYTLSVQAGEFTDQVKTLKGAQLRFATTTAVPTDQSNVSQPPLSQAVTLDANGAAQPLLVAPAGSGVGEFHAAYTKPQVALNLPAGNLAGQYHATLMWSLAAVPVN